MKFNKSSSDFQTLQEEAGALRAGLEQKSLPAELLCWALQFVPRPWGGEVGDELRLQNIKYPELEGITECSQGLPSLPDVIPTTQNWSLVALVTSSFGSILSLVLLLPSQSSSIGMTPDPVLGCDLCDS